MKAIGSDLTKCRDGEECGSCAFGGGEGRFVVNPSNPSEAWYLCKGQRYNTAAAGFTVQSIGAINDLYAVSQACFETFTIAKTTEYATVTDGGFPSQEAKFIDAGLPNEANLFPKHRRRRRDGVVGD